MTDYKLNGLDIAFVVFVLVAVGYFSPASFRSIAKRWLSVLFGAFIIVYGILAETDLFWRAFQDEKVMQNIATWSVIALAALLVLALSKYTYLVLSRPRESGTQS